MAHFAEIDKDGIVLRVIVVADADTRDKDGVEREELGVAFCNKLLGGTWKQTSYSGRVRKNYAGVGWKYDDDRDAFIPPRPDEFAALDEVTCQWRDPKAQRKPATEA